jgi:arginine decarboxylase
MGQDRAPLLEAIYTHVQANRAPFHVPAHLGQPLPGFKKITGEGLFPLDLTELPGLDDLHCPTGPLQQAQELAAQLFGARSTFFLVNGVTVGILAAHLYYGGKGKKILLPRDAHRSHYAGLILAGSSPVYLPIERQGGISANVSVQAVAKALESNPDAAALFVTSPGYHGACADLVTLRELTAARDIPLVVDEAHGTYLGFSPALPPGAGEAKADLWLQSTHKTGGALTQGGMLHVGAQKVDPSRLAFYLSMLQTSSPSYLIMASLDEARRVLAVEGRERVEKVIGLTSQLRRELIGFSRVREITFDAFRTDPLKLSLSFEEAGLTGSEAGRLMRRFGVEAELAGAFHLLFIFSLFHTPAHVQALLQALTKIVPAMRDRGQRGLKVPPPPPLPLPRQVLPPGEAAAGRSKAVPLLDALGRIAAEMVVPSPPGIPLLVPGEEISQEVLTVLEALKREGLTCQLADPTLNTLKVLTK